MARAKRLKRLRERITKLQAIIKVMEEWNAETTKKNRANYTCATWGKNLQS